MKAKEYLCAVRRKELHIKTLMEKREALDAEAQGLKAIVYDKDRVQVSPANRMEEMLVKIAEIDERYEREIQELHDYIVEATRRVMTMDNTTYAEILRLRYLTDDNGHRMSFERISCIMHKSFDWVRHLHGAALAEFERKYLNGKA